MGETRSCHIYKQIGNSRRLQNAHRPWPISRIQPATGMVPHRMNFAFTRLLRNGIGAYRICLGSFAGIMRSKTPQFRIDRTCNRAQKLRLEIFVAIGKQDMSHPKSS